MTAFTRWLHDEIEDEAVAAMLPGLVAFSGQSEAQLRLAVNAPRGSLARMWLLQIVDRHVAEASAVLGRPAVWSDVVSLHRKEAAA